MCMGADFQALDDVLDCLPTVADVKKRPQLSRVQRRLIEPRPEEDDLVFQHSVFCQTGLPYRDPGRRCAPVGAPAGGGQYPHPGW